MQLRQGRLTQQDGIHPIGIELAVVLEQPNRPLMRMLNDVPSPFENGEMVPNGTRCDLRLARNFTEIRARMLLNVRIDSLPFRMLKGLLLGKASEEGEEKEFDEEDYAGSRRRGQCRIPEHVGVHPFLIQSNCFEIP